MTEDRFKNKNVVQIFFDPALAANPNKRKCRFCETETYIQQKADKVMFYDAFFYF